MSKVWYGNLTNRLEEGKNFNRREIRVGDDITMYHWSDRTCYYVTDVIDQKHIKVRRWYTSADQEKADGIGHQEWVYFKTLDERNDYLAKYHPDWHKAGEHFDEPLPETWVYRYNKWMREYTITEMEHPDAYSKREREQFAKKGFCKSYYDLSGRVSFGVRDYHYDWEF